MEQIQKSLAYLFLSICLFFAPDYADNSGSDNSAALKSKYSDDSSDIQRYQYEDMLSKNKKQEADLFNSDISKAFLSHRNYQQNSRDTDKNNRLIISDFSLSLINIQTKINLLKEELKMQKRMTEQLKLQLEEYYKNLSTRLSLLELKEKKPPSDTPPSAESIEKSEPSLLSDKRSADDAVAYNNALTLTREQKFQEAIAAFNNFILKYSQSQHVPDALYWLGEIYSATGKVEQAKEVFFKIIDKYPQGDPCADAMYKYAIILAQSGDRENAVAYLHKVVEKYPLKSVAELAKRYLKLLN